MFLAGPKAKHEEALTEDEVGQEDVERVGQQSNDD